MAQNQVRIGQGFPKKNFIYISYKSTFSFQGVTFHKISRNACVCVSFKCPVYSKKFIQLSTLFKLYPISSNVYMNQFCALQLLQL